MRKTVSILQILLGLWSIMGAVYMIGHYADLASPTALAVLPGMFWMVFGVVHIVFALALGISVWGKYAKLSAPVAIVLALITLSGSFLYTAYSGFPGMLWSLIPAALYGFIAYKKSI